MAYIHTPRRAGDPDRLIEEVIICRGSRFSQGQSVSLYSNIIVILYAQKPMYFFQAIYMI